MVVMTRDGTKQATSDHSAVPAESAASFDGRDRSATGSGGMHNRRGHAGGSREAELVKTDALGITERTCARLDAGSPRDVP